MYSGVHVYVLVVYRCVWCLRLCILGPHGAIVICYYYYYYYYVWLNVYVTITTSLQLLHCFCRNSVLKSRVERELRPSRASWVHGAVPIAVSLALSQTPAESVWPQIHASHGVSTYCPSFCWYSLTDPGVRRDVARSWHWCTVAAFDIKTLYLTIAGGVWLIPLQ